MTTVRFLRRTQGSTGRAVGKLLCMGIVCLGVATSVFAQEPPMHRRHAGVMPPGAIGGQRLSRGGPLSGYFQPVEIRGPRGSRLSVAVRGRFQAETTGSLKAGLLIAPVYRLRVTEIPRHAGAEVFPTVEIVDRLYPPPGVSDRFPIPIEITEDDLRLALEGRFVTRVIYLEDPEQAAPIAAVPEKQNWFEAPAGVDPLVVADRLGRPVAILRIGSRLPESGESASGDPLFTYGSPPVNFHNPVILDDQGEQRDRREDNADKSKAANRQRGDVAFSTVGASSDVTPKKTASRSSKWSQSPKKSHLPKKHESPKNTPLDTNSFDIGLASYDAARAPQSGAGAYHGYATLPPEAWSGPPLTQEQLASWRPPGIAGPWPRDEYLHDGGDFVTPAVVRANGAVSGLEQDDTIVHFDTLDGRTLVQPSNRVHIYAPRFGAVRRVDGLAANTGQQVPSGASDTWKLAQEETRDQAKNAVAQQQPIGGLGVRGASVYRGRQQSGGVELPVRLFELRGELAPYEDFHVMRAGRFERRQKARLEVAVQAAKVWDHTDVLVVMIRNLKAFELTKDESVGQTYGLDEPDNPRLRIIKIASNDTALPGEVIDFSLRFDNVGDQVVGNVTILDNLSTRLDYVPNSAECSRKAQFFTEPNGAGAQVLRWQVADPMRPGEGGLIRFRCRVR